MKRKIIHSKTCTHIEIITIASYVALYIFPIKWASFLKTVFFRFLHYNRFSHSFSSFCHSILKVCTSILSQEACMECAMSFQFRLCRSFCIMSNHLSEFCTHYRQLQFKFVDHTRWLRQNSESNFCPFLRWFS